MRRSAEAEALIDRIADVQSASRNVWSAAVLQAKSEDDGYSSRTNLQQPFAAETDLVPSVSRYVIFHTHSDRYLALRAGFHDQRSAR